MGGAVELVVRDGRANPRILHQVRDKNRTALAEETLRSRDVFRDGRGLPDDHCLIAAYHFAAIVQSGDPAIADARRIVVLGEGCSGDSRYQDCE